MAGVVLVNAKKKKKKKKKQGQYGSLFHCDLLVGVKRPLSLSGRLEFGKERLLLNHMSILGEAK